MKSFAILVFGTLSAGVAAVYAQTSQPITPPGGNNYYGGGGYGGGYHSSTAAEGAMRGMGDLVRSQGEANLNNSAAAINFTTARSNQIDNRNQWTNTYFEMRQANRAYRLQEMGPRATMADAVRSAQAGMPKPLSPSQLDPVTGAINWPTFLRSEADEANRAELERVFGYRAKTGAVSADDFLKARQASNAMLAALKKQVREIPPEQYSTAKRFLQSLAYQAGQPVG